MASTHSTVLCLNATSRTRQEGRRAIHHPLNRVEQAQRAQATPTSVRRTSPTKQLNPTSTNDVGYTADIRIKATNYTALTGYRASTTPEPKRRWCEGRYAQTGHRNAGTMTSQTPPPQPTGMPPSQAQTDLCGSYDMATTLSNAQWKPPEGALYPLCASGEGT